MSKVLSLYGVWSGVSYMISLEIGHIIVDKNGPAGLQANTF